MRWVRVTPRAVLLILGVLVTAVAAKADGLNLDTPGDYSTHAAREDEPSNPKDSGDTRATGSGAASAGELEATRAALDRRNRASVSLDVSGWVGGEVSRVGR